MSRLLAATVVLFLALPAFADDKSDKAKAEDLKAMVGDWKIEKAVVGGKDMLDSFKTMKFEIHEGGKYTHILGKEKDEGTFTIDPSKELKECDITIGAGPTKGTVLKAIYKVDKDTMTICYELSGTGRPTAFESKPDTKVFLAVYQRSKK